MRQGIENDQIWAVLARVVRKDFFERMAFSRNLHDMKNSQLCAELGKDY